MGIKGILAISAGLCTVGGISAGCYYGFSNTNKETKTTDNQESTTNTSPTNLETNKDQGTQKSKAPEAESPTSGGTTQQTRQPETLSSSGSVPEQVPAAPQSPSIPDSQTGRTQDPTSLGT